MKRVLASPVCLATLMASVSPGAAIATESAIASQELQTVMASDQVKHARWSRQPDAYVLRLELPRAAEASRNNPAPPDPAAVQPEDPPRITPRPQAERAALDSPGRGSFFINNTVENLRGLDPAFCGRTLTLIDGRRSLSGERQAVRPPPPRRGEDQPYATAVRDPRVEVWLLKADGTHILPGGYRCGPAPVGEQPTESVFEISYTFAAAEGEHAIAAAIRVRDDFFIEMLHPLQSPALAE